jgi:hypothetical protein
MGEVLHSVILVPTDTPTRFSMMTGQTDERDGILHLGKLTGEYLLCGESHMKTKASEP